VPLGSLVFWWPSLWSTVSILLGFFFPRRINFFSDANMINEHPSCMYDRSFHFGFGVSLGSL
jgi:hypothetical protein